MSRTQKVLNRKKFKRVKARKVTRRSTAPNVARKGNVRRAFAGALLTLGNAFRVVPLSFKTDTKSDKL